MNSIEHFKAAEDILTSTPLVWAAENIPVSDSAHTPLLARALVHAILALDADDIAARAAKS